MTDWRAVGVGFVVLLVTGAAGLAAPGVGQLLPGLLGGFAAGYLAGGGFGRGAWHGLLAGSVSGVVLTVLLGGAGVFVAGLVLTVLFGLESALAGAVGAALK